VKDRALAKCIDPDATWYEQFDRAYYGGNYSLVTKLVGRCLALEAKARSLETQRESLDALQAHNTVYRALRRLRGKEPKPGDGFTPEDVVKGARGDAECDQDVVQYYTGLAQVDSETERLSEELGYSVVWCIRKRDFTSLHKIAEIAERLDGLMQNGVDPLDPPPIDPKRASLVVWVGKDAEGKMRKTARRGMNLSWLAGVMGSDKREVQRFCREDYGVTLPKGKPGRPRDEKQCT
jgi:hypothetical protein